MPATIPQTDPRAEYLECRAKIDDAIRGVLEGGRYILGEEVAAFEREFATFLTADYAVGVASGTDALTLALRACGIGPGDEVITVSHTATATVTAIERSGATPVLVDVDAATFTLEPGMLDGALTSRTRAVVPVHLYGQPVDMPAILRFAQRHGLRVVEDCAQAHGAAWRENAGHPWKKAGAGGDAAAFSFYPTKNLGALGDGGCVVTGDAAIAEKFRLLREYGWRERFVSEASGWKSRLDEVQAAILRVKLRHLDRWNEARRRIAGVYDAVLAESAAVIPVRATDRRHVFHQYVIRLENRDRVRATLAQAGIGTAIHYPVPVHKQPAYATLAGPGGLEVTARLCGEILSLPMHPHLGAEVAGEVALAVLRALNGSA